MKTPCAIPINYKRYLMVRLQLSIKLTVLVLAAGIHNYTCDTTTPRTYRTVHKIVDCLVTECLNSPINHFKN